MKRFALAVAIVCVLSGSALAGDSHTAGEPAPAPSTSSSSVAATVVLAILSFIR